MLTIEQIKSIVTPFKLEQIAQRGECADHSSGAFFEQNDEIELSKIAALRNIAAHGYWQLNME
jgi:uncharacterized protein with HEPN domain